MKVWHFLHDVNDNKNINIEIKEYVDECIICNACIRLKNIPNGCITMICDKLDRKEYLRLININIIENDIAISEINIDY